MSKIDLDTVPSGHLATTNLNDNFQSIEDELNNKVLYRDNPSGEPNQMLNDLDMNSNRIINLPSATTNNEPVTYAQWIAAADTAITANTTLSEEQTAGSDGQSLFTLSLITYNVGSKNLSVYRNGTKLPSSSYTETSTSSITLNATNAVAVKTGDEFEFIVNQRNVDSDTVLASNVTFTPAGAGAVASNVQTKLRENVSVKDFGAVGDGVADDTVAIQAALDYLNGSTHGGGRCHLPPGIYKTTSTLLSYDGIIIQGSGRTRSGGVAGSIGATTIVGTHTGAAVISLKGATGASVRDLTLESDPTTFPKTALLLGRDDAFSAGHHLIQHIRIQGKFSAAAIYSIASEVNRFNDVYVWNLSGGGKYGFYTSAADDLSVDSLTSSTNLVFDSSMFYIINASTDADAACIYMECDESMGGWNFNTPYLIPYAGSYIELHNAADSQILGPINFWGGGGERLSGGDPLNGIKITSDVANWQFKGLTAQGMRFDFLADATHAPITVDSNTVLVAPNVALQPPEAFPYAESVYTRENIKGGFFKVDREYEWTDVTLAGTWINGFGSPYAQAGYKVDGEGKVSLRGTVSSGTSTIFTLPTNYRPAENLFFTTNGNGAIARILITASTGVVSLFSGTGTLVDLSGISFFAGE